MVPRPSCSTRSHHDMNPRSLWEASGPSQGRVSLQGSQRDREEQCPACCGKGQVRPGLGVTGCPGSTAGGHFCLSQGEGGRGYWC